MKSALGVPAEPGKGRGDPRPFSPAQVASGRGPGQASLTSVTGTEPYTMRKCSRLPRDQKQDSSLGSFCVTETGSSSTFYLPPGMAESWTKAEPHRVCRHQAGPGLMSRPQGVSSAFHFCSFWSMDRSVDSSCTNTDQSYPSPQEAWGGLGSSALPRHVPLPSRNRSGYSGQRTSGGAR